MMKRILFILPTLLLIASGACAQDAKSFALAGCGTGTTTDAFGVYWNPAVLALRENAVKGSIQTTAGFSAWDTSNLDMSILDFSETKASQTAAETVTRAYRYHGLFAVQYRNFGGGLYYEDNGDLFANQGALDFKEQRSKRLDPGSSWILDRHEARQKMQHVFLSAAKRMGGGMQFLALGGSIKFSQGSLYNDFLTSGTFQQGLGGGETSWFHSEKGRGLSYDVGIWGKFTQSFQAGAVIENIRSDMKWDGTRQIYALDPTTGMESAVSSMDEEWKTRLQRNLRIGLVIAPEGKDIILSAESRHVSHDTTWRFGLERLYPKNKVSLRMGTFKDSISSRMLITLGGGIRIKSLALDLALLTRKLPAIMDSQSLGGAFSLGMTF